MKKTVSIVLCLILLLGSMSVAASAAGKSGTGYIYGGEYELTHFDPTVMIDTSALPQQGFYAVPFFADGPDSMYMLYSYLNQEQKDVYNAILNAGTSEDITATLTNPVKFSATTDSNNYLIIPDEVKEKMYKAVVGGISAAPDDHPEIFWLHGFGYGYDYDYDYNYSTGLFDITINSVDITITYASAYADEATVKSYSDRMAKAVKEFTVNGNSRYEKVKSIHDRIVAQVQYDSQFVIPTAHEPTSVFLEPYTTVCEGYSEAFKILCNRENIPCVIIVGDAGGGHAWNYVKMEDGKWYAIDSTWDDPVGARTDYVGHTFFLVGADTPTSASDTFASEHTPTGQRYTTDKFALTYPTLSKTAYSKVLPSVGSPETAIDESKGLLYIGKDSTFRGSFSAINGTNLTYSGITTGGTLTVSGNSTGTYTLVRRADVDADSNSNANDVAIIRNIAVGKEKEFDNGTAKFYAGDMNHDGTIDGFDAIIADLYVNGVIEIE